MVHVPIAIDRRLRFDPAGAIGLAPKTRTEGAVVPWWLSGDALLARKRPGKVARAVDEARHDRANCAAFQRLAEPQTRHHKRRCRDEFHWLH